MGPGSHHIVFICSRLDQPGGIEKAIVSTANLLQSRGKQVSLIVMDDSTSVFFPIHPSVAIISRPLHFGITRRGNMFTRKLAFSAHVRRLRQLIVSLNPDIVVATEYQFVVAAYLAAFRLHCRLYSWEHHHFHHLRKSRFWTTMIRIVYPRLNGSICLNTEEARLFSSLGGRTLVIPNFIDRRSDKKSLLENRQLLTVGWLSETKGVDLIPRIADLVFARRPDWKWKIIGSGDETPFSGGRCPNVEIQPPVSPDIAGDYRDSAIYVLTSRFECFPMVLLEAMSLGVPCIAFDCPTGPRHIITDGRDGMLIKKEDTEAMASAILDLIGDIEKRKKMGAEAFENSKRFSEESVYLLWEKLLEDR